MRGGKCREYETWEVIQSLLSRYRMVCFKFEQRQDQNVMLRIIYILLVKIQIISSSWSSVELAR